MLPRFFADGGYVNNPYNVQGATGAARSDYAACAGTRYRGLTGADIPTSYLYVRIGRFDWPDPVARGFDGICYQRSTVTISEITDGTSNVYMVGEKYINPDEYETGTSGPDNETMYVGDDRDILCNTRYDPDSGYYDAPFQDAPGLDLDSFSFGSAHPGGWNMVFCDGSVRTLSYDIDLLTHSLLGSRADGAVVDMNEATGR